jgi:hypothetical protein
MRDPLILVLFSIFAWFNCVGSMECKLVLVGTKGTGKSALAIRFSHEFFMEAYDPTVEDSYRKRLNIGDKEVSVELQKVADYEPNEGFSNGQQIRDASGFVLVYSVSDSASFEAILTAKQQIEKVKGSGFIPMVLCGAKADVPSGDRYSTLLIPSLLLLSHFYFLLLWYYYYYYYFLQCFAEVCVPAIRRPDISSSLRFFYFVHISLHFRISFFFDEIQIGFWPLALL